MKSRDRATLKLLDSVRHDLNMYALAAGAAGVSVMALAQPSEAEIVYTPAHVRIGRSYNLDLNHDGITDVSIDYVAMQYFHFAKLFAYPAQGNSVKAGLNHLAFALNRGYPISSKGYWSANAATMVLQNCGERHSCRDFGDWVDVLNRYLGLRFKIHGKTHYGWARLNVNVQPHNLGINATLTGYAYETIPGKSIVAGRTKGPEDDIVPDASLTSPIPDTPQPASLGMLALGAQGVQLWRRKESALEGN